MAWVSPNTDADPLLAKPKVYPETPVHFSQACTPLWPCVAHLAFSAIYLDWNAGGGPSPSFLSQFPSSSTPGVHSMTLHSPLYPVC